MSTQNFQENILPANGCLQIETRANLENPPSQPYQVVEFEEFRREYDMSPEEARRHYPSQENDLDFINCQINQNAQKNSENMPLDSDIRNSTPHNNKVTPRESDVLAIIAREELSKQLNPLMASISVLKKELSSRMDSNIAYQNQLLLRIYQNKAFKQTLKDNYIKFDGRDVTNYNPWKNDLKNEIRDLVLTASQELQILESRTELEPLQIVKNKWFEDRLE